MNNPPTINSSLDQWLHWLESLHTQTIDLGLARVAEVAGRLSFDLSKQKVITIAGTNGKGSCVAALEALLLAHGDTVGCYTSPHLLRYNERVRLNGDEVDDESLVHSFVLVEAARGNTPLTYFEFGTLAAMALMQAAGVEHWLLEVGLGGRLDAVNIIDPTLAIITSIDLDHQDWLGDNREAIGAEKAGIMREETPVICADFDPPKSVIDTASELEAPLLLIDRDFGWRQADDWQWWGSDAGGPQRQLILPTAPLLPWPSVAAAAQAFLCLGYEFTEPHAQALAKCGVPGRCQRINFKGKQLILDVAHNPAAVCYLLSKISIDSNTAIVFAAMADKDIPSMFGSLVEAGVQRWYLCDLADTPRAASAQALLEHLRAAGAHGECYDGVAAALSDASVEKDVERIVVMGSFYTVAAALAVVEESSGE